VCLRGLVLVGVIACRAPQSPLFELLPASTTGVSFANELPEDTAFNILNYLYYYNGGGVAAGDVNNDGLPDVYFTSNLGPDRLYLNRGNFRFEDVTDRAGVRGPEGWSSGVTMADVNGDGWLDLYVSAVSYLALRGTNVLYLNNRDGTFSDKTKELGLEHTGYSTQAAFFDYDNDGDLDMYLLNSSAHSERGPSRQPQRVPRHPRAGDRFFRNDGTRFTDVSEQARIHGGVEGYGLGVVASDLNGDGCLDIYVANDFQENDFVYYNDCNGTFTESVAKAMGHTSQFSMGVDAADFNNDGRSDLVVLDMLPEREEILKTSAGAERFDLSALKVATGYHPQFARNTLQLNRGGGRFSDIGYLAGVHATDWSWAPLFADLDNDGHKDLFITNGIYRRPNDLDYIEYVGQPMVQAMLAGGIDRATLALLQKMPRVPLSKYAYRNNGDLTFTNMARAWGLAQPGFSNGAAYVDLNNDGALDLVVNNINSAASIYRNRGVAGRHWLQVQLRGAGANTSGIGAKVIAHAGGRAQLLEQMPTRGFQSSVDHRLHFGFDSTTRIDSLVVVWPNRRSQTLTNVAVDRPITLSQADAKAQSPKPPPTSRVPAPNPLFADVTSQTGIDFTHRENDFVDFNREPLIPHMLSTEGPALAVGDVNGDSLDDLYIGGARGQAGQLFIQRRDGKFVALDLVRPHPKAQSPEPRYEDVDAAFFDADGDKDLDLYVVSGGGELTGEHEAMRDRLYVNDGRGNLTRNPAALPAFFHNGSTVAPADFDRDGDVDLFVGSRSVTGRYGEFPTSYLLENDGKGRFVDITASRAESVANVGMVTSAAWIAFDGDGKLDLVVAGEWMPIRVFRQQMSPEQGARFVERTAEAGLAATNGWWNTVTAADLDGDGDADLVLGNLGLNSSLRASRAEPARLHVGDFDGNGSLESILTVRTGRRDRVVANRDELVRAIPTLHNRYPTYADFARGGLEDILALSREDRPTVLDAFTFASVTAVNEGGGRFVIRALPPEAQLAPVFASLAGDFDGDGRVDLLLGGNFYGVTPTRGRYDASHGLLLAGGGNGAFTPLLMEESGVAITGQVRALEVLRGPNGRQLIAIARNNDRLQILRPNR
jgi:hypothetical protein